MTPWSMRTVPSSFPPVSFAKRVPLFTERIVSPDITQVPEGCMIFPRLTIKKNLFMGAFLRRDRTGVRQDEEHVSELFPVLLERRSQMGGTLSGGEQQLLAIGRPCWSGPSCCSLMSPP